MTYFLPFFPAFAGTSGLVLGGRPMRTSRMRSRVSGGYIVALIKGLIPAAWILCRTVFSDMPSFSANSGTVIPSISKILKISDNIDKQSRAPEKSHHASRRFLATGGGGEGVVAQAPLFY